jgi:hypothetical protein
LKEEKKGRKEERKEDRREEREARFFKVGRLPQTTIGSLEPLFQSVTPVRRIPDPP